VKILCQPTVLRERFRLLLDSLTELGLHIAKFAKRLSQDKKTCVIGKDEEKHPEVPANLKLGGQRLDGIEDCVGKVGDQLQPHLPFRETQLVVACVRFHYVKGVGKKTKEHERRDCHCHTGNNTLQFVLVNRVWVELIILERNNGCSAEH